MTDKKNVLRFRCDDAAGYEFQVLRADDGDLHLSLLVNVQDYIKEHGKEPEPRDYPHGSVRIRMPMMGGGSHEKLYDALCRLFKPPEVVALTEDEARWLFKRHVAWEDGPFALREKLAGVKRRRRPNPRIPGWVDRQQGPDLDEFMKELQAAVRRGVVPGGRWTMAMAWFAEKFRAHAEGKDVDTVDVGDGQPVAVQREERFDMGQEPV